MRWRLINIKRHLEIVRDDPVAEVTVLETFRFHSAERQTLKDVLVPAIEVTDEMLKMISETLDAIDPLHNQETSDLNSSEN